MAFDNHTQEQIQRYLDSEMSASEQEIFEKKLAFDEALAQEIALQKDIAGLLADTPEHALRKNLQTLSDQYQSSSSSSRSWRNFLWLVPFLLIGGIWFFNNYTNKNKEEVSIPVSSETLSTPNEPSISPVKVDTSNLKFTDPQELEEEKILPIDNQENKTQEPSKEDSTKAPVYADDTQSPNNNEPIEPPMIMAAPSLLNHDFFAPLPLLDSLMAQNFQSEKFQLKIQQALPDTITFEEAQTSNYSFNITLSASQAIDFSLSDLGLYLYPNHAFYWKENHPWDFTPAQVKKVAEYNYQVQLTPNLNLEPGLYYYALRSSKKGEVFFVAKLAIIE